MAEWLTLGACSAESYAITERQPTVQVAYTLGKDSITISSVRGMYVYDTKTLDIALTNAFTISVNDTSRTFTAKSINFGQRTWLDWGSWEGEGEFTVSCSGVPTIRVTIDSWTQTDIIPNGAYWEAGVDVGYSVTYNANGGTGAPAYQTKSGFISSPLTLSTTIPTRTGYTFKNWNTAKNGSGTSYAPGATYSTNAVVTLYAQWTAKTYTLTVDPNGGYRESNGSTAISTSTVAYGATSTIGVRKRDGYTLVGYTIKRTSDGSTTNIGGATVTLDSSTKTATFKQGSVAVTLVAQWQSLGYTVTYDLNTGGTAGASGVPSSQEVSAGSSVTVSSTVPTWTGWTFVGWATSSSATSATYVGGNTFTPTASITLYAVWKKTLTITYNANGGSGAPSTQTLGTVWGYYTDKKLTGNVSSTKPTKSGYTFLGWSTTNNATSAAYQSGGSITLDGSQATPTGSTLYAIWSKTITVTYNANGGSGAPSAQSGTVYNSATSYDFAIPTTQPTKSGSSFLGWSTSSSATSASYAPGGTVTLSSSTTLYAVWATVAWSSGATWIKNNGAWSLGIPWVNVNGTWKIGCGYNNNKTN